MRNAFKRKRPEPDRRYRDGVIGQTFVAAGGILQQPFDEDDEGATVEVDPVGIDEKVEDLPGIDLQKLAKSPMGQRPVFVSAEVGAVDTAEGKTLTLRNLEQQRPDGTHLLHRYMSSRGLPGYEDMMGNLCKILAQNVKSTYLNVMLLVVFLRYRANLMQSIFLNGSIVVLNYHVFKSLMLTDMGADATLARSVLNVVMHRQFDEKNVLEVDDKKMVSEITDIIVKKNPNSKTSDYIGNFVYQIFMNKAMELPTRLNEDEMKQVCVQIVCSCSSANYRLLDKAFQFFDRDESLSMAICIARFNVNAALELIYQFGYVPTFSSMTELILMLNLKSMWRDFNKRVVSCITCAPHGS